MISSLYIINLKGEIVIFRTFRDDVSRTAADAFKMQVLASKDFRAPVQRYEDVSFFHVRHENVFFVAASKQNVNALMVFQFLFHMVQLFRSYFEGKCDEGTINENFSLIYELLDEAMDYGYPQITHPDMLKTFILHSDAKLTALSSLQPSSGNIPPQVTGAVSWRREGLRYRKNEVFLDVVEHVNLLFSAKGTVLKSDVAGEVVVKAFLSGMPECKFGMNDKLVMDRESKGPARRGGSSIELDDTTFHQCVRLGKFDTDRTISFIPPDGEFTLMKYRVTEMVNLPFRLLPIVKELGRSRVDINVKLKADYSQKLFALNVFVRIPVPPNTAVVHANCAVGKSKYEPENHMLVWRVRRFPGQAEFSLSAEVELAARIDEKRVWSRPPISMEFQVPMYTASGLHVRFLKIIEKENYQTVKWVRYITKNGSYMHRI